uniref:Uncharacterized protein n=1 Tax=Rhizophora mucronata TaxID=61149 RepID=A0A2P2NH34_RHIMU
MLELINFLFRFTTKKYIFKKPEIHSRDKI